MADIEAEVQADVKDRGSLSRHPLRTMAGAFAVGTAIGVGVSAAKHRRRKNSLQKFLDQIGK